MNATRWYWAVLMIVLGMLLGRVVGGIVFEIFGEAGPILLIILLPLLIIELLLRGAINGMLAMWRGWRGVQSAQSSHPTADPDAPWLVRKGLLVGFTIGLAYSFATFIPD